MSQHYEASRKLIAPYLGRRVEADLDGAVFEHQPATFRFRFRDPAALQERLDDDYEDYLTRWDRKQLVPVASVASAGSPDYEFAWIFLDWRKGGPRVVVTTTDRWKAGDDYTLPDLAALKLEIGEPVEDEDEGDDD